MSKYTTELRFICETSAGLTESVGFNQMNNVIESAAPVIFDFDFPIFDEAYRLPLEIKILRHFYTREIGEETVGLWKLRLQTVLCEIMPYYNQLYASELYKFNPLYDVDYWHESLNNMNRTTDIEGQQNLEYNATAKGTNQRVGDESNSISNERNRTSSGSETVQSKSNDTSETTGSNHTENTAWDVYSDTPQGGINGIEGTGVVNGMKYITNARKNTLDEDRTNEETVENNGTSSGSSTNDNFENESVKQKNNRVKNEVTTKDEKTTNVGDISNSSSNKFKGIDSYSLHVFGKRYSISYSELLMKFRETFLNIDKMILEELEILFFGLW